MSSTHSSEPATSSSDYPVSDELLVDRDEHGVLLVTFNRPDRNNGWTFTMEEAYFGTLIAAANDPAVKSIVVTGAGKSFCPGLDLQVLETSAKKGDSGGTYRRPPMTTARLIPKPVIGAINGVCAGIGFIQMACCDVVFASSAAKFTTAFARRGLPAENGLSWLLPRLVGTANAMDLLLSARLVLADEAKELGLVSKVVEPDDLLPTALAYGRDLAVNCSPTSMATIKRQVIADWERGAEESGLRALIDMSELAQQADFLEGVMSFRAGRPGHHRDLPLQLAHHPPIDGRPRSLLGAEKTNLFRPEHRHRSGRAGPELQQEILLLSAPPPVRPWQRRVRIHETRRWRDV